MSLKSIILKNPYISTFLVIAIILLPLGLKDMLIGDLRQSNMPMYAFIFGLGQLTLSFIIILLMKKTEVFSIDDFRFKEMGKGFLLAWFGILVAVLIFLMSLTQLPKGSLIVPNLWHILVCMFATMTTGIFEEILCRGFALKILLSKIGNTKKGIIKACFVSSLFFGLAHFYNIISVGEILPVTFQVIYATAVGFYFAALYLRTKRLWILIIVHALINFSSMVFGAIVSPDILAQLDQTQEEVNILGVIIGTAVIAVPFTIAGIILIRKVNPQTDEIEIESEGTE